MVFVQRIEIYVAHNFDVAVKLPSTKRITTKLYNIQYKRGVFTRGVLRK